MKDSRFFRSGQSKFGDRYTKVESPTIGRKYHLSWANYKCHWVLKEIYSDGTCLLKTPKTHKILSAKLSDLRNLKNE